MSFSSCCYQTEKDLFNGISILSHYEKMLIFLKRDEHKYFLFCSALLEGENDFCMFLNQSFPRLGCRELRSVEWCTIRKLIGKPRR